MTGFSRTAVGGPGINRQAHLPMVLVALLLCLAAVTTAPRSIAASGVSVGRTETRAVEDGMRVIVTGAGVPAMIDAEGGASVAVIVDDQVLQFDMGPLVVERLVKAGIGPHGVDHLFLTHFHIDHIADFPEYASMQYVFGRTISVFGPPGTRALVDGATSFMAAHLESYQAITARPIAFDVTELDAGGVVLETQAYRVTATPTPHMNKPGVHSFAYRVDSRHGSVVISGDTAPSPNVVALARDADILVHEASLIEPSLAPRGYYDRYLTDGKSLETLADGLVQGPVVTGHTTPTELGKVAQAANVGQLVVYHTLPQAVTAQQRALADKVWAMPEELYDPAQRRGMLDAIRKSYSGPVEIGRPLMVFEIGRGEK